MYQVFKQAAGACDDIGGVMEPGWYFIAMREGFAGGEAIPSGPCIGPYRTKREAERAARLNPRVTR